MQTLKFFAFSVIVFASQMLLTRGCLLMSSSSGTITNINNYWSSTTECWKITVPENSYIILNMIMFSGSSCRDDT
ncbi:hypothetical protein TNCT_108371 [Trichonephila clavata]|uniref:Uncharacterized protein n=1 Tax=Trichonephila clavata TaxID=2740835 RepID=A0A8X6EYF6_TRICU|nr:hypothetical protein TNCT_108371 [Trichonephila clavata]